MDTHIIVRKRGRPPGSKNKKTAGDVKPSPAVVAPTDNSGIVPKKRGRPPKNPQVVAAPKPELVSQEIPVVKTDFVSITNKPKEETKIENQKNYKQFEVGDRVKKITNGEIEYVKIHKPDTRDVYVNWGGDYMDFAAADLLELVNPIPKKQKKSE